eukprot:108312_1
MKRFVSPSANMFMITTASPGRMRKVFLRQLLGRFQRFTSTTVNWTKFHKSWILLKEKRMTTQSFDIIANLMKCYTQLSLSDRENALCTLVSEFGILEYNKALQMINSSDNTSNGQDLHAQLKSMSTLREAITPEYERLFQLITHHPGGLKFLINLREDILAVLSDGPTLQNRHILQVLSGDLRRLFALWFGTGFLELRPITWDCSASLLEYISQHEAVHRVRSVADLKSRLGSSRRFFAFFHPNMPTEPLVFVEVALLNNVASSVQQVLAGLGTDAPETDASTAIFYSICSTQRGLSGIDLGEQLLHRVITELKSEFPKLDTFCTLSPVVNFRSWLMSKLAVNDQHHLRDESLLLDDENHILLDMFPNARDGPHALYNVLSNISNYRDHLTNELKFRKILTRLCERYLCDEKRRSKALDPVCNFHCSNGASLLRLNWMGDTSRNGLEQGCGFMVNYLYHLPRLDKRSEQYASSGNVCRDN